MKELTAQTPAPPVRQPQQQDTIKARTDSIRASIEAESRRTDSSAALPAPALPPAAAIQAPSTRRGVPLTPAVIDSGRGRLPVRGPAPSQGVTPDPVLNPRADSTTGNREIPNELIPSQLESARLRVSETLRSLNRYEVEIQKKFALAAACFIFVLLGAPIALRFPRAGVGLTIGVSLVVFGLYYVGLIAGESLARRGLVPPFVSMWIANVVFLLIALILLARMGRETGSSRGDFREVLDNFKFRFRKKPAASVAPRSVPRTSIS